MHIPCFLFVFLSTILFLGTAETVTTAQNDSSAASRNHLPDLLEVSLAQLRQGLQRGDFTSVDLVTAYLARIKEVNSQVNAVLEVNPEAHELAARLDDFRRNGKEFGPLSGIPILIKDNIATYGPMNTTAGSFALLGAAPPRDATVVRKLKEGGAIILGKTNMSQWAFFRSYSTTPGWSARGGQTFGAYVKEQDPQGSSSGSAVAAALGLAWATLGSETSGSILLPAENSNVVGLKPTVGLTSRELLIPVSQHQDTIGPIARRVIDAAYLLQAIAGKDRADNYTSAQPFRTPPNYPAACKLTALRGARIGVPRNLISDLAADSPVLRIFNDALDQLRAGGAIIVDNTNVTTFAAENLFSQQLAVLEADFFTDLPDRYLCKLKSNPKRIRNLADLRTFTQSDAREAYPDRDTLIWDQTLQQMVKNTDPAFWQAYQTNLEIAGRQGIEGLLANHSLSALVLPTSYAYALPGLNGSPAITVPMGALPASAPVQRNDRDTLTISAPGFPVGLTFFGQRWSEERLIGLAYAFEQRTNVRLKLRPLIRPMTGL